MKNDKHAISDFIFNLLKDLDIPKNRILYLHVKLRNIQSITGQSYLDLTKSLLDSLRELFQPTTILVPAFTYSFTRSGIYHRLFSRSEVGRFSEDVRQHFVAYRTPDPIFSVLDVTDYLSKLSHIDYTTDFQEKSLFKYLSDQDYVTINFDREDFGFSQFHYIERLLNVSYRYNQTFEGIVYHDETNWERVSYTYFVRDLEIDAQWNRPKIKRFLVDAGAVHTSIKDNTKILWGSAQQVLEALVPKLQEDDKFLIT